MSRIIVIGLFVLAMLSLDYAEVYSFMGGMQTSQGRTIGGKNPLKQTSIRRGNPQTRIYHNSRCSYFKSKQCTIVFKSAQEAQLSGFRPCSKCGG